VIAVRDVRIEDAAEIAVILNSIIAAGTFTIIDTPVSHDDERAFIRSFPPRGVFLVAVDEDSGAVLGFQDVAPFAESSYTHAFDHVGVIGTYVDLSRRRQGIGTRLFAATFEAARAKGYEKLFSYVRADNNAGLNAYLKHGFRTVGIAERHAKIGGRYIDEVLIEKIL
jgi:L-amino acid N-acyltransferase YncA